MNSPLHSLSIREKVQGAIASGAKKMHSRSYFMLLAALSVIGVLILSLTLLYLASFIFFSLRYTGIWYLPSFGMYGLGIFMRSLPWILIIACLIFIVLLETVVTRYAFAYRRPLLYSIVGIIAIVLCGGFVIGQTPLHDGLLKSAQDGRLPFAGSLYRGYCTKHLPRVHAGVVRQVTKSGFRIENRGGETLSVTITPRTRFPRGAGFADGDEVLIVGARASGTVEAYGMRAMHGYPRPQGLPNQQNYRILLPQ